MHAGDPSAMIQAEYFITEMRLFLVAGVGSRGIGSECRLGFHVRLRPLEQGK